MATWPATIQQSADERYEAALLQSLLNELANAGLTVDGAFGPNTKTKVIAFQTANGLTADGIVGPMTWQKLFATVVRYVIEFESGHPIANDPATTENDALYDCIVEVRRVSAAGIQLHATYRGSITPDDLGVDGRVNNGWYRLHLGFHKRRAVANPPSPLLVPTATDLVVKNNANTLRPCLVVNRDLSVSVTSNDPTKTTADAIHVHNGFNNSRGSDGCQTIRPSNWAAFIQLFLDNYAALDNWYQNGTYYGKEIGVLIIE